MGIVAVAALAEMVAQRPPPASNTATGRFTSSTAIAGNRSSWPAAQRYSILTFCPVVATDAPLALSYSMDPFEDSRGHFGSIADIRGYVRLPRSNFPEMGCLVGRCKTKGAA